MHKQKRIMQISILFGVLSIPTLASADGGLLGSIVKQPTEIVKTVTEDVANTTSQVEEALPFETDQGESLKPVTTIVNTANDTTQKVTKAVASEKTIVELNVSTTPSVKVNTGVVDAEVSRTPKVKLDTGVAKVKIADAVKVETEVVQAEVKSDPQGSVQVPVGIVESSNPVQPNTNNEELNSQVVETKRVANPIQSDEKVKPNNTRQPIVGEGQEEVVIEPTREDFIAKVEPTVNEPEIASPLPMKEPTNFEQVKVTPTFQSGPTTQSNTGYSTVGMTFAVLNGYDVSTQNGAMPYFGKTRLFFDQWLNAPPSQPPQHSLFTISRI